MLVSGESDGSQSGKTIKATLNMVKLIFLWLSTHALSLQRMKLPAEERRGKSEVSKKIPAHPL
jgi:hypothetical protein